MKNKNEAHNFGMETSYIWVTLAKYV